MAVLAQRRQSDAHEIQIPVGSARLNGELTIPENATGIVLFAHGSGSSRRSPEVANLAAKWFSKHLK